MNDLLAILDAGIERHYEGSNTEGRPNRLCRQCTARWPCETLRALKAARVLAVALTTVKKGMWNRGRTVAESRPVAVFAGESLALAAKEMEP